MDKLAHRKATTTLRIVDSAGQPIAGKEVSIRLTNHKFLFGCGAFDAIDVANRNVPEEIVSPSKKRR